MVFICSCLYTSIALRGTPLASSADFWIRPSLSVLGAPLHGHPHLDSEVLDSTRRCGWYYIYTPGQCCRVQV
ncbi:hypothetical protein PF005_g1505 [Phytophthora fragariae]|uniref:Uncharacterized protein n=1 Tax=Phytophthora fragariae TaxID=53985 RepID=A0A6A4EMI6_9STRA|nr:hypothetical protein PF003_g5397 [Phytophthora fragariae]KAE8949016.1 hypothetical protein PF009_g1437 [Phytophthora fragariae]KAE9138679.1 hypothetical protein PF007_g1296 [Phytophthora fragariae]KAE9152884.1 hypothetical protein PF006_g2922 [Phytophthora fragariae]KAE9235325.1 hypothetical protein PF005_g1505 [Phytophthora fragariae]